MSRTGRPAATARPAGTPPLSPAVRTGLWVVLVVMVGVALAVGATRGPGPATVQQRAAALDAVIRCPSCDGISVAQSSASTAQAIRQTVLARLRGGQSPQQVEAYLVSRYGPGILLRPPVGGGTAWVWVLPPVAVAGAAAGLGAVLWRRRRRHEAEVSEEDRALVELALARRAGATTEPGP